MRWSAQLTRKEWATVFGIIAAIIFGLVAFFGTAGFSKPAPYVLVPAAVLTSIPTPTPTVFAMRGGDDFRFTCAGLPSYIPANPVSDLLCIAFTPTVTATPTVAPPTLTAIAATFTPQPTVTPVAGGSIVAAFHYPWFPGSWMQGGVFPYTQYHPTLGYYNSSDDALIDQQISLARNAHLQAFITSWWGQGTLTDQAIQHIVPHANVVDPTFRWAIYYEAEGQGNPTTAQITSDLTYLNPLFANPNYLRINNKPVVFVYADGTDASGMAVRWAPLNANYFTVLKVYPNYKTDPNQPGGWHQYAPAVAIDSQLPYSVSVSPGFFKSGEVSPRLARNITTFNTNVQTMVAAHPQFELITTWNEWGEGSSVEPASEFTDTYINALCAKLPGQTPCNQPLATSTPIPATATPTIVKTATPIATVQTTSTVGPPSVTPTRALDTSTPTQTPITTNTATRTPTRTATASVNTATATAVASGGVPNFTHIYVLMMENKEYGSIVGSSSAPYLNSLINQYGLATNYNGVAHPSEPNYLALFSGSTQGVTDDAIYNFSTANLGDQLETHGLSWREYSENRTLNCFLGATSSGGEDGSGTSFSYARKHSAPTSFTQITGSPSRCANLSDFTHFDPAAADFIQIAPNQCHDTHDCSVSAGDSWLASWLPGHILNSAAWQDGLNLLFIVWDEGTTGTGGGGHVANIVVSNDLKSAGIKSATPHNHYSLLRTIQDSFGIPCLLNSCNANNMGEFFK